MSHQTRASRVTHAVHQDCAALALGRLHEWTHAAILVRRGVAPTGVDLSLPPLTRSVRCDGVVPRNRWIAVLLAPLVAMSLVPLATAVLLGDAHSFRVALSLGNALVSSGDALVAGLVLTQVTPGAVLRRPATALAWRLEPPAQRRAA